MLRWQAPTRDSVAPLLVWARSRAVTLGKADRLAAYVGGEHLLGGLEQRRFLEPDMGGEGLTEALRRRGIGARDQPPHLGAPAFTVALSFSLSLS